MPGVVTAYQSGVHGSRPANGTGCILYACSTHNLVYRDDGTSWTTWLTITSATRASLGLDTTDSPQFAGLNIGHASDTTVTRTGAGDIAVEGNAIYRAGGTDVPIADGGTGASTKAAGFDALSPMTTSGDIIYGGASGTGTRLAKGSDGQVLTLASGLPSWAAAAGGGISSGTSNPGSPSNGDLFYRSDLDMLIRYRSSGTRWVCTCPHIIPFHGAPALLPVTTAAGGATFFAVFDNGTYASWVEKVVVWTTVVTTNNGSHYWTMTPQYGDLSNIASAQTTAADTADLHIRHTFTAGAVAPTDPIALVSVAKTGTPGNIYAVAIALVRYIIT